jgi:dienelactone hydrolase
LRAAPQERILGASMKQLILLLVVSISAPGAPLPRQWQLADEALLEQFRRETRALSEKCLTDLSTKEDWNKRAPEMRQQLAEMLSLSPMPPRTDLKATITKRFEHDTFAVENLHFQSSPGLYVTANLYVPKNLTKPAPTILYVCGHGPVITNGVSYGNKFAYHHHGIWFARNGYVCLIIDTLQLGEIQGLHHGTHREGLWWWNSRGYSPAGVETWNGIRALDYLSTRPEVDTNRFGITGRSGGGAYSWFVTAMDDRIKAAAPVAGITDLENHVVDGAVEGHCDCMFFVNTYRWDYPQLAALAAPRPLLLCNSDSDSIFPLDGIMRTHNKVRNVYELLGASEKFGLVITPGPHKDTQELQVPVMRWFNKHLKDEESPIENAAVKLFTPQQLKVFDNLPTDAVNTNIHFTFVEAARLQVPKTKDEWVRQRDDCLAALRSKSFRAWPQNPLPLTFGSPRGDLFEQGAFGAARVPSEPEVTLDLRYLRRAIGKPDRCVLWLGRLQGAADPPVRIDGANTTAFTHLSVRGEWPGDAKKQTQIRRRLMLLGATLDSKRVWDIIRGIQAIRASKELGQLRLCIEAEGDMAVNALYASLFAPVDELVLTNLPRSHMNAPDYLNVLRILDIPQAVAMASERCRVELRGVNEADWQFASETARVGGFEKNLHLIR